ncbi:MAG: shikimate kinase AroK [Pseudomonadota bacterium]
MNQQNIFLVGLMAVGKSTVGRLLAESLQMPFYDTDIEIESRAGAEVAWIFDVEGEQGFRDREEQVIDELSQENGIVVATGGGAVKRPANRLHMGGRGTVIHLDCSLNRLLARTRKDKKRPLLQGDNREQVLRDLIAERAPLYQEIADYRFLSEDQSPKTLASQIRKRLVADGVVQ